MNYLFVSLFIFFIPTLVSSRHWFPRPTQLRCRQTGVACLSKNLFVYCKNPYEKVLLERDGLRCPEGYLCQENSPYPCVQDPENLASTPDGSLGCTQASSTKDTPTSTTIKADGTSIQIQDEDYYFIEPEWTTEEDFPAEEDSDGTEETINGDGTTTSNEITTVLDEDTDLTTVEEITNQGAESPNTEKSSDKRRLAAPLPAGFCSSYDDIHPGPSCSQYYVCEWRWIWWYEPSLKSCDEGEVFSLEKLRCVPSSESECID